MKFARYFVRYTSTLDLFPVFRKTRALIQNFFQTHPEKIARFVLPSSFPFISEKQNRLRPEKKDLEKDRQRNLSLAC